MVDLPLHPMTSPTDFNGAAQHGNDGLEPAAGCLFCGSAQSSAAYTDVTDLFFRTDPGQFDYRRCADCGSLWLERRPCGQRLLDAYAGYYTHGEPDAARPRANGIRGILRATYVADRFGARATTADKLLARLLRASGRNFAGVDMDYRFAPKAPARLLDYGCGSGEFLLRMAPLGYELRGAEYDPQLLDNLSRRGIPIDDVATLSDQDFAGNFDHITLAHVIEHVADPVSLLRRLGRWLRPGGTLFLEVPNADATGLDIFGKCWRGLETPRHFALPSRRALISAFADANLDVVHQHINRSARRWVWRESLDAAPECKRDRLGEAIARATTETPENAEFLTFVLRKPA